MTITDYRYAYFIMLKSAITKIIQSKAEQYVSRETCTYK